MISTRPSHISTVQTQVEKSLKGAKDPNGPANPNAGPDVAQARGGGAEGLEGVELLAGPPAVGDEEERADRERQQVQQDEDDRRAQRLLIDDAAVDADGHDRLPVDGLLELALDDLEHQQVAHDLDPAAGRARARAREHQQQQGERRERAPERIVGGREPGRGEDRRGLEERVPDARLAGLVAAADDLDRDQHGPDQDQQQIEAQLLVPGQNGEAALHEEAVQPQEVDPGDDHEDQQDVLRDRGKAGDRVVARGEAAERDHAQRLAHGVERRQLVVDPGHAQEPEHGDGDHGEHDIEPPQPAGGRADRVAELLDLGRARRARTAAAGGRRSAAAAGSRPRAR